MFICLRLRSLAAEDLVYTKKFLLLRLPYQEALNSSAVVRHLERTGVKKVKTDSRKKVKKNVIMNLLSPTYARALFIASELPPQRKRRRFLMSAREERTEKNDDAHFRTESLCGSCGISRNIDGAEGIQE